jgi:carbon-monoxide dehydrogenase medium subunit
MSVSIIKKQGINMRRVRGFEYIETDNLNEALLFLDACGRESCIFAGGTDLISGFRKGGSIPKYILNIKKIPEIREIKINDSGSLIIGACNVLSDIEHNKKVRQNWSLLSDAVHLMANPHIRNRGTIGGNLCNASPAADTAPVLLALGADVEIVSINGCRTIPLNHFFLDAGKSCLSKREILTKIIVPNAAKDARWKYIKYGIRNAMEIGLVNVAVSLSFNADDGSCKKAKIVLGSVAPTPIRALKAESALEGNSLGIESIKEASYLAAIGTSPISDVRASSQYRKEITKIIVERALTQILNEIQNIP